MTISREVTITVWHGGTHPPDGKDMKEELRQSEYHHVGFTDQSNRFLTEMLDDLVAAEHGIKTGDIVKVTLEIAGRTEEQEFSHLNRNLHAFQAIMGMVSLEQYWAENYEQYKWEGVSLYEHLCREMDLEPIDGFTKLGITL